ncbi:Hsp20/alpha crystallin family protein [Methanosarcina sp. MSH10X1]|nr:Hsp20/alpha crystallin family protein [Methanosarcina sp. MSH10X1]
MQTATTVCCLEDPEKAAANYSNGVLKVKSTLSTAF